MQKGFLSPDEIMEATIVSSHTKAYLPTARLILLSIMSGAYVGFGGLAYVSATQTLGNIDIALSKFLGAALFPIGLMLVILTGSELFTGNNLMTMAYLDKKIKLYSIFRNWFFVYFGNLIGSVLLAVIVSNSGLISGTFLDNAIKVAVGKTSLTFLQAFLRGILCNILVCISVWMSSAARDIISRLMAIWFPVMLFVFLGFEHSVANMFLLPLAKFSGLDISWISIWTSNLIPVTLGNLVGGAVILPLAYYISYIVPKRK